MISAKTDWKSNGSKWDWESNSDQDLFFFAGLTALIETVCEATAFAW